MSNFSAEIQARLNTSSIANEIKKIEDNKIDFRNISLNTSKLVSDIQSALNNNRFTINLDKINMSSVTSQMQKSGAVAGKDFSASFNSNLSSINTTTNNAANTIQHMKETLTSMKFDRSSIDLVTKDLQSMSLAVSNVTTRINGNNLNVSIRGIDELGRAVTIVKQFDYESGRISTIGKTICQSFDTGTDATKRFQREVNTAFSDLISKQKQIGSLQVKLAGLDSSKDLAQIEVISNQIENLKADYNELQAVFGEYFSTSQIEKLAQGFQLVDNKVDVLNAKLTDISAIQKQEAAFKELYDIAKQMDNLELKIGSLNANSGNETQISVLKTQLEGLRNEYQSLFSVLQGQLSTEQLSKLSNSLGRTQDKLEELDAKHKLSETISTKLSNGTIEASIAKVTAQYEKLGATGHSKLDKIKTDIRELSILQTEMNNSEKSGDTASLVANYEKFNSTLAKVKNNLSVVSAESKTFVSELQVTTLDNKIATWMEKNSKASKEFGASIDNLRNRLASLNRSSEDSPIELNRINQEFDEIVQTANAKGLVGSSVGKRLKGAFSSILNYVSISTVIYQSISALKEMYQNVYNIDTEMTELKKVTNETEATYSSFLKNAGSSAKEIGTTISDLVSSTADFARLGYSFSDSQELAKVANIYSVVGDEVDSIDTATKSIISTMTAFGSQMDSTMSQGEFALSIIDKFNEVGNNYAISSGGIGEALERSASSMAAANNTLDETIALITAANTVVQDPTSVGTAFKTKFLRNCLYVQKCA